MNEIARRFGTLWRSLEPTDREYLRLRKRLKSIRALLENSFPTRRVIVAGSHRKGTALRNHSDLDIMVALELSSRQLGRIRLADTKKQLIRMRRVLLARYPNTTIRTSRRRVVLNFNAGKQPIDVVPAYFEARRESNIYVLPSPDGNRWWRDAVDQRLRDFDHSNHYSGGRLARLIKMLKHWLYSRTNPVPIKPFYLEILFGYDDLVPRRGITYSMMFANALETLSELGLKSLDDPLGVSNYIPATSTRRQRHKALRSLKHSHEHAVTAIEAEEMGDFGEAARQWNIVFNGQFTPYGRRPIREVRRYALR